MHAKPFRLGLHFSLSGQAAANQLLQGNMAMSGSPAAVKNSGYFDRDRRRHRWNGSPPLGHLRQGVGCARVCAPAADGPRRIHHADRVISPRRIEISPIEIVARERRMQVLSAVLTAGAVFEPSFLLPANLEASAASANEVTSLRWP